MAASDSLASDTDRFGPYIPSVAASWPGGTRWRPVTGSLLFVDISGFTNLSERLARRGRIGAEELTSVLDRIFGRMLEVSSDRGGSLIKFGGDALLLLFDSEDHVMQACAAAVEMRAALREASKEKTSVGRINLKMSSGIHTGTVDFFLVGSSHRELIVTGPVATVTTQMESTAEAGEILVSPEVRAQLPADFVGKQKGDGWILRKVRISHSPVSSRAPIPTGRLSELVPRALRETLASPVVESEHRMASIAFVKFKGIDELLANEGHERVADQLELLIEAVQGAADKEDVTFLASDIDADGGKVILVSGVPESRHDDEGRLLRAARQVVETDLALSLRIGVNRGHVFAGRVGAPFRRTYTIMGDSVNLAARLMAAASPGMIYSTSSVLDRSSTLFRAEPLEPFKVKGKDQPVTAYAVQEETGVRPPELEHELPFHGRNAELEMLVSIVTTCAAIGRGGMMTLTGETGVGKSRLISEVIERCPGLATLLIQAEPNGRENAYWALRDPLRRVVGIERGSQAAMAEGLRSRIAAIAPDLMGALPLLGDALHIEIPDTPDTSAIDPQFRPERTADAVIKLIESTNRGPFIVIAEDGQWLDDASLGALKRLGTAAESKPWSVIVTAVTGKGDFEPIGQEIVLKPLTPDAIRQIAIEATAAAPLRPHELDNVVARADGNPLFLAEILRVIRDTGSADRLPDSLDEVVSREIDTLPPLTRQLLRYASVLGRSFRRPVLDEFLEPDGVRIDDATELELARFIERKPDGRMQFRHVVVHDVAYEGLSYRRRRELHNRAGHVIERMAGADTDAVAEYLATHYSLSGAQEKVWHYARVAADRAKKAYANTEAAAHYRRAAEAGRHLSDVDSSQLADVWILIGEVNELSGQMEASRDAYSRAFQLDSSDPVRRAEIYLRRAGTWMSSGKFAQAMRNVTLGRKQLLWDVQPRGESMLARLNAFEASVQAASGRPEPALEAANRAVESALATREEEPLARAYGVLDWANFVLGRDEPRKGPEAIEILRRLSKLEASVGVINNMGAFAYLEGKWNEAIDWYRQAIDAAERAGDVLGAAITRANMAEVLVSQRRCDEALLYLEEAERTFRASNADLIIALRRLQSGRAALGVGDYDRAISVLESLFADQLAEGEAMEEPTSAVSLGEALLAVGRPEETLARLNSIETIAPEAARRVRAGIARVRALALAAKGDVGDAEEALRQGLSVALESGDQFEEALIREAISQMRGRVGKDPDPANEERLAMLFDLLGVSHQHEAVIGS
ncbi:MAG TPA: adenylate/guanylate cyclase domain-containing protein [Acidimicrobiia bacterium]|nr:adenylate/guanylate cyclase domain-containing protein [Acidimicrobiia bacterium]